MGVRLFATMGAFFFALPIFGAAAQSDGDLLARGEYVLRAGACIPCHTDFKGGGKELAGGRGLKTPFGLFYSPNITPDPETGIGRWTEAQFRAAVKQGVRPDGKHYYPVFPYPTYTRMTDGDLRALFAYLKSRPPVRQANKDHDLVPPFSWRSSLSFWKSLNFQPSDFQPDGRRPAAYNRGAYLATALAHCGECHTPRDWLGGLKESMALAGTRDGPEGEVAPNITPHPETGIGKWSHSDLVTLLKSGQKPDFDNLQGVMQESVDHGFKYLTDADLAAIATFVMEQNPIANKVSRRSP